MVATSNIPTLAYKQPEKQRSDTTENVAKFHAFRVRQKIGKIPLTTISRGHPRDEATHPCVEATHPRVEATHVTPLTMLGGS